MDSAIILVQLVNRFLDRIKELEHRLRNTVSENIRLRSSIEHREIEMNILREEMDRLTTDEEDDDDTG